MIQVITAEGTFTVPGTAEDVHTDSTGLRVTYEHKTIAHFRRWLHWLEAEEETTNA
ncbi:hypothetical protein [Paeniglutamicibacter psychrophenolicus]|uniref:hypothetical protein n=1 Tax=Paeniglutamicibacter psychrophenolicus TaxID=257454 RepID=UPI0027801DA8|nr:hypothetical protein [Paeniglutamicibacter psychrophenolicus]MDQ0094410.1 hypothetical protein [Paeniglutamicibacter psychrophenolicus]